MSSLEFAKVSIGQDGTRNRWKIAQHQKSVIEDRGFVLREIENLSHVQRQNGYNPSFKKRVERSHHKLKYEYIKCLYLLRIP
jgi:hypothetical protein